MTPKTYLANLLMVIGGLAVVLSGGCTIFFIFSFAGADLSIVPFLQTMMFFGGVPFFIGLALFFVGRNMKSKQDEIEK